MEPVDSPYFAFCAAYCKRVFGSNHAVHKMIVENLEHSVDMRNEELRQAQMAKERNAESDRKRRVIQHAIAYAHQHRKNG